VLPDTILVKKDTKPQTIVAFWRKGNLDGRLEYSFKNDGIIEVCRKIKLGIRTPYFQQLQLAPSQVTVTAIKGHISLQPENVRWRAFKNGLGVAWDATALDAGMVSHSITRPTSARRPLWR
jgi:hypothetical protein